MFSSWVTRYHLWPTSRCSSENARFWFSFRKISFSCWAHWSNCKKDFKSETIFWNTEILIFLYPSIDLIEQDENIDTFLNFASFRSASQATWEALLSERFSHIVIVAEGIPEREIREILTYNETHANIRIIWPATAGAIVGGTLRMGNSGGSLENIVASSLYQNDQSDLFPEVVVCRMKHFELFRLALMVYIQVLLCEVIGLFVQLFMILFLIMRQILKFGW